MLTNKRKSRFDWSPTFHNKNTTEVVDGAPDHLKPHVALFLQNGFVVIPNSVSTDTLDAALSDFHDFKNNNAALCSKHAHDDGYLRRIINLHMAYEGIQGLFQNNPIAMELQDYLYGEETSIYTSLFFEGGSQQDIHRDSPYFTTVPEYNYFGMWVALEDASEDNGTLMVVRGGHLIDELDREAIANKYFPKLKNIDPFSPQLWDDYQRDMLESCIQAGLKVEIVNIKKGETLIWHPQLPHGGSKINKPGQSRKSIVFHTTPMKTPVYHQDKFFNPTSKRAAYSKWGYAGGEKRKYALTTDCISFEHAEEIKISDIRRSLQPA